MFAASVTDKKYVHAAKKTFNPDTIYRMFRMNKISFNIFLLKSKCEFFKIFPALRVIY